MSATDTMERTVETSSSTTQKNRRPLIVALAAVVALLLGALGGWLIAGGSDDAARAYAVGGGDLTERQEEMVQMVEDYVVAIQDRDAEAIMDMYGPMAVINIGGTEYSNADGTLEQFWSTAEWAGYQGFEPMLVGESTVVFGTEWVSRTGMTVIGFQPGSVGPVKIISHEMA